MVHARSVSRRKEEVKWWCPDAADECSGRTQMVMRSRCRNESITCPLARARNFRRPF
jgi:hypothetical protein